MARGDIVIANSGWTADRIRALHPWAADRIVTIHRGTDLSRFDPGTLDPSRVRALRAAWAIPEQSRIILLPARLTAWKGHDVLINAFATLLARGHRDLVLVFAGDPQGRDGFVQALDAHVTAQRMDDFVRRVGHVADVPAAIAAADVVTAPSTQPEAFGRIAIEAQAMRKPVIVSDLGASPETVRAPPENPADARTGWRVPAGDHIALADALDDALRLSTAELNTLGQRARDQARGFSLEAMATATLAVYRRLLGARQQPS